MKSKTRNPWILNTFSEESKDTEAIQYSWRNNTFRKGFRLSLYRFDQLLDKKINLLFCIVFTERCS